MKKRNKSPCKARQTKNPLRVRIHTTSSLYLAEGGFFASQGSQPAGWGWVNFALAKLSFCGICEFSFELQF
ncbi:hypothetical protein DMC01_11375 [Campylobacter troglodytis]|nr:hypothetical protein DMC01_11375 [Campylobacter troglodytis]